MQVTQRKVYTDTQGDPKREHTEIQETQPYKHTDMLHMQRDGEEIQHMQRDNETETGRFREADTQARRATCREAKACPGGQRDAGNSERHTWKETTGRNRCRQSH